jgi:hypothetical protein
MGAIGGAAALRHLAILDLVNKVPDGDFDVTYSHAVPHDMRVKDAAQIGVQKWRPQKRDCCNGLVHRCVKARYRRPGKSDSVSRDGEQILAASTFTSKQTA